MDKNMTTQEAELILGKFFKETGYQFPKDTERVRLIQLIKFTLDNKNK
jgi:hypothetical protein